MAIVDTTIKLLGLSETMHRWRGALVAVDATRRDRVAHFCEEIAGTLARAATALAEIEKVPGDEERRRGLVREVGRIAGYVEHILEALHDDLDGRKLAGVKKRLEALDAAPGLTPAADARADKRVERLLEAEGYFRALADGLRAGELKERKAGRWKSSRP